MYFFQYNLHNIPQKICCKQNFVIILMINHNKHFVFHSITFFKSIFATILLKVCFCLLVLVGNPDSEISTGALALFYLWVKASFLTVA